MWRPSFDDFAKRWEKAINSAENKAKNTVNDAVVAVNEAKNTAYNAVNSLMNKAQEVIKQLDVGCQQIANAIREWAKNWWITSINFIKETGELVVNGVKHKVKMAVGKAVYTLDMAKIKINNTAQYLTNEGKILTAQALQSMQKSWNIVSNQATAFVKATGQNLVEFTNNAQTLIEQGKIKAIQLAQDGKARIVDGKNYVVNVAVGAVNTSIKMTKEGIQYYTTQGIEIAKATVDKLQTLWENAEQRAKAAGQNVKDFLANTSNAIQNGVIDGVKMTKEWLVYVKGKAEYAAKVTIGAAVYYGRAGQNMIRYTMENGKRITKEAVATLQKLPANAEQRAKAVGQDVTKFLTDTTTAIQNWVIDGIQMTKEGLVYLKGNIKYATKVAIGATVYYAEVAGDKIGYAVEGGKMITKQAIDFLQKLPANAEQRAKVAGQDVTKFLADTSKAVQNGVIDGVKMAGNTLVYLHNQKEYARNVVIGMVDYAIDISGEKLRYLTKAGKELAADVVLSMKQWYTDLIAYGRKKGQDMTDYAQYLQNQVNQGVIDSFNFVKEKGILAINGVNTYIDEAYSLYLQESAKKADTELLIAYGE